MLSYREEHIEKPVQVPLHWARMPKVWYILNSDLQDPMAGVADCLLVSWRCRRKDVENAFWSLFKECF